MQLEVPVLLIFLFVSNYIWFVSSVIQFVLSSEIDTLPVPDSSEASMQQTREFSGSFLLFVTLKNDKSNTHSSIMLLISARWLIDQFTHSF